MEIANEVFKKNMILASQTSRNYIIDQTNVLLYSRIEKLQLFEEFYKEAVVLVLSEQEQKKRMIKKEKFISKNSFLYPKLCLESFRNLQENFILPDGEGFDNIIWGEMDEEKARKLVFLYNSMAAKQVHPLLREKKYGEIKNKRDKLMNDKNKLLFEDNNSKFNKSDVIDEHVFNDLIELEKVSMKMLEPEEKMRPNNNPLILPTPITSIFPSLDFSKTGVIQEKNIVQQPQMLYSKTNLKKPDAKPSYQNNIKLSNFNFYGSNKTNSNTNSSYNSNYNNYPKVNKSNYPQINNNYPNFNNSFNQPKVQYPNNRTDNRPNFKSSPIANNNNYNPQNFKPNINRSPQRPNPMLPTPNPFNKVTIQPPNLSHLQNKNPLQMSLQNFNQNQTFPMKPQSHFNEQNTLPNNNLANQLIGNNNNNNNNTLASLMNPIFNNNSNIARPPHPNLYSYNLAVTNDKINNNPPSVITNYSNYNNYQNNVPNTQSVAPAQQTNYGYLNNYNNNPLQQELALKHNNPLQQELTLKTLGQMNNNNNNNFLNKNNLNSFHNPSSNIGINPINPAFLNNNPLEFNNLWGNNVK